MLCYLSEGCLRVLIPMIFKTVLFSEEYLNDFLNAFITICSSKRRNPEIIIQTHCISHTDLCNWLLAKKIVWELKKNLKEYNSGTHPFHPSLCSHSEMFILSL